MKNLSSTIEKFKHKKISKYFINTGLLLECFMKYEIDFDIDENMFEYLNSKNNIQFLEVGNTFNLNGRLSDNFYYMIACDEDLFYVSIKICQTNEPRCNSEYIKPILLAFDSYEEFYELLDEFTIENFTFEIQIDDRKYLITPQFQREDLLVRDSNSDEEIDGIYATNDEELISQISRFKRSKIKKRGMKNEVF